MGLRAFRVYGLGFLGILGFRDVRVEGLGAADPGIWEFQSLVFGLFGCGLSTLEFRGALTLNPEPIGPPSSSFFMGYI